MEGQVKTVSDGKAVISPEIVIKEENTQELSSNHENEFIVAKSVSEELSSNNIEMGACKMKTEENSFPANVNDEIAGAIVTEELSNSESLPIDIQENVLKVESSHEDIKKETVDSTSFTELNRPLSENIILTDGSSKINDGSNVTLKRKSDSLAMISSYQISSDSEEDVNINRDAFLKPQVLSETESESDSESDSDGLPVFNIDSDIPSESGEEELQCDTKQKKSPRTIKAPGEIHIDDLPPIKDLQISVKEEECLPFGKVHSIVETLVVIEALPDVPALNLESVLFTKIGQPLGEVFDVFGPVKRPYYTIRFNCRNDIEAKSLSVGTVVYCAPKTKYTQYVFIHQLAKMKGSDASWKGDAEPPPGYEEYSDDEQERRAKKERKESRMKALAQEIIDIDEPPKKIPSFEERMNRQNTIRNQLFSNRPVTPPRRGDWFRNAAPGAGRPMPEEGSSRTNIIKAPNFTAPPFQRQATPPAPPSYHFSSGSKLRTPPPASQIYPLRNNQTSPKFPSSPNVANVPPIQNYGNGNPFTNRPQSSISSNIPVFQMNSPRFQQNSGTYQSNNQNFLSSNSQSFQRNIPPPFRQLSRGFQSSNQGWSMNNHSFGGQPSFPGASPPFTSASNFQAFPQNRRCWHKNSEGQGLPANNPQFPPTGLPRPQFTPAPPPVKPYPQLFQQNCPPFVGQNFQRPSNPPFSCPSAHPFSANGQSFQSQTPFCSPQNQAPPPFMQNNQLFPNVANYQQANSSSFSPNCRPFPPK